MRILMLGDFDTGGQGWRFSEAFRKHGDGTELRSMVKDRTHHAYPLDLPYRAASLEEQYQAADVIHVRNHFTDYDRLVAKFGPKPCVIHFHGSKLRGNPDYWIREVVRRGAIALVSTIDLYLLAPDVFVWQPSAYDVDALEAM